MKRNKKRIRTPAQIQQRARELCKEMTPAEKLLWSHLRNKRLKGLKFRRQHPLGPFIADFYCAARRLVVEIDGDIHDLQPERDAARTEQFKQYGYRVIRFRNRSCIA
ncbi:MAG: endonuclease domain-containing protein [Anaerolineales bacterium]|nr:MAG: endonuclease domain-containing protein [Anaerolineales bacterium]